MVAFLSNHQLIFSTSGCSVLGAILIVAGLYSVLWGKYREDKEKDATAAIPGPDPLKCIDGKAHMIEDIEANDIEAEKAKANKLSFLDRSVTVRIPETPIKSNGANTNWPLPYVA